MTEMNKNQMNSENVEHERIEEVEQTTVTNQESTIESIEQKPVYEIEKVEQYKLKFAGFWTRLWAYLIDLVVVFSIGRLIVHPIFKVADWDVTRSEWYAPIVIISAVIFYGYFVLMTKFFKQTVGKMVLGIRVISLKDRELTWSDILFREWIGRFFSTTIIILYAVIGFTPKKQGLHDFIADTTVVHEEIYNKTVEKVYTKRENVSQLQEPNAF